MINAVIDLGTNTFNLLIFQKIDSQFQSIHSERIAVGLGQDGITKNFISRDAYLRGLNALIEFKKRCEEFNVQQIHAVGTSALRGAENALTFCSEVFLKTGISIEIISGTKEAELIYKGVSLAHDFVQTSCIMDIGGGSTEFIFTNSKGVIDSNSFDIGVSRIIQKFNIGEQLNETTIFQLESHFEKKCGSFFRKNHASTLVGSSGSFESYYELINHSKYLETCSSVKLDTEKLFKILEYLIHSTGQVRDKDNRIVPIRKSMIHIAALKTRWVINQLKCSEIWLSSASLKEGVMSTL